MDTGITLRRHFNCLFSQVVDFACFCGQGLTGKAATMKPAIKLFDLLSILSIGNYNKLGWEN